MISLRSIISPPISIHDLQAKMKHMDINKIKSKAKILLIDDKAVGQFESNLRKWGYANVRLIKDLDNIDDVSNYDLILCDIKGVGKRLSSHTSKTLEHEGLTIAEEVKRLYPTIKVISYSADIDEYKNHYITRSIVDGFFAKDEDPEKRNKLIDQQLMSYFNPVDAWLIVRRKLLDQNTSIYEVAKLESYYVKVILGERSFDKDKASAILHTTKDVLQALAHLATIVSFVIGK